MPEAVSVHGWVRCFFHVITTCAGVCGSIVAAPVSTGDATDAAVLEFGRAVEKGDLKTVNRILAGGIDVNQRVPKAWLGYTPLFLAIHAKDPAVTEALLKTGADPMIEDENGDPAMVHAAHHDRIEHARLLIAHGVSIDSRNHGGITALLRGAPYEDGPDTKAKLDLGANPDLTDSQGNTALMIAAESANLPAMKVLIEAGAKINVCNKDGNTALILAATRYESEKSETVDAVKLLIKGGADINLRTPKGNNALMAALDFWNTSPEVIQTLLEASPDIGLRNEDGCDALFLVVSNHKLKGCIPKLLELGADIKTRNSHGTDLLMLAAGHTDLELAADLIKRGLSPALVDQSGRSAVHHLFRFKVYGPFSNQDAEPPDDKTVAILKLLHEHGASLTASDKEGDTPLHLAAMVGHIGAFRFLMSHFPEPDLANAGGESPLHLAAMSGSVEIINLLLEKHAEIDSRNSKGVTPLMLAIAAKHEDACLRLLEAGADINAAGVDGKTALAAAIATDDIESARFLLKNGANPGGLSDPDAELLRVVRRFHDKPTQPADDTFLIEFISGLASDMNRPDADGITPLMWIAASNNQDALKVFLKRGPNLDARSPDGRTALMWAACARAADSMRMLGASGANESLRDSTGRTAAEWFEWANVDHPDPDLALPAGQSPPSKRILASRRVALRDYLAKGTWGKEDRVAGITPLHLAASLGDLKAITELIQEGATPNIRLANRATPLMEAATNGELKAVELLIENGADPGLRDAAGMRAIDCAVDYGHADVARLLLRENGVLTADETSLLVAAIRLGDPNLLRACLEAGASIPPPESRVKDDDPFLGNRRSDPAAPLAAAATRGDSGMLRILFDVPAASGADDPALLVSALHRAADRGRLANVRFLIEEHQVDPNAAESGDLGGVVRLQGDLKGSKPLKDYSALSRALEEGHDETVRYLVKRGVVITGRTRNGSPPVTFAVQHGRHDMLRLFLENSAPLEIVDFDGQTALHRAAASNDEAAIRMLLEHGADLNAKTPKGLTPLDIAREKQAHAAVALLEKRAK